MARSEMQPSPAARPTDTSARMLFHLGMLYCLGHGVDRDYVAAQKWLSIAALKGSIEARHHRCLMSREMTANQIAEAQRQARAWITLS